MNQIEFAQKTGKYTLIGIKGSIPNEWNCKTVLIDGLLYDAAPVYDLQNHFSVVGEGISVGQMVEFPLI